jgi:pyruvate formate lyase activating enzyme
MLVADGAGYGDEAAWDLVTPHVDNLLFCVKTLDPDNYVKVVGNKPDMMLAFANYLIRKRIQTWIRYVVVPGLTDSERELQLLADFVKTHPYAIGVEFLPYHTLGAEKWRVLKIPYTLDHVSPPSSARMREIRTMFANEGIKTL